LRGSQKLPIERSIGQPIIEKVIGIEDSGKWLSHECSRRREIPGAP
jgi:hypothetical protein